MSKYTTLLFDADSTLLDFKRSEYEAVADCLAKYGLPSDDKTIKKYAEINDYYWKMLERREVTKPELFIGRWKSLIDFYGFDCNAQDIADSYSPALASKSYLIDGAEEICKSLYRKYKMFIVTNGFKVIQNARFGTSPLTQYFDDIFISEEIGHEKPSIEFFNEVEKRIPDFNRNSALIIGDSLTSDILGGIVAGIDTCWFNPNKKPAPADMNITYTISKLQELQEILL